MKVAPAIVIVPLRGVVAVFAAALIPTVPLPLPLAPDVTLNHVSLLTAAHGQPVPAVMLTVPVPPAAVIAWLVGLIAYEHVAGACVAVIGMPATVNVQVRDDVSELAIIEYVAVPDPEPEPVTVNQTLEPLVVQAHPGVVVTAIVPVVAVAGAVIDVGDAVKLHAGPSLRVKTAPPIVSAALRAVELGLAAALKLTTPLAVPLAPDVIVNHVASLVAVQAQPNCVVRLTLPAPPVPAIV